MSKKELTLTYLKFLLDYDPITGHFTWKNSRCARKINGTRAGAVSPQTQNRHISIDGKLYIASRLAWFYTEGVWPKHQLIHVDGVADNNARLNLREKNHAAES